MNTTYDDRLFINLCRRYPDRRIERDASGTITIMTPAGGGSSNRNAKLCRQLEGWVEASGLGVSFDSSVGFKFPNDLCRSPDASWVRSDRWDTLTTEEQESLPPICPDFVIELRSPTDKLSALRKRWTNIFLVVCVWDGS